MQYLVVIGVYHARITRFSKKLGESQCLMGISLP